MDQSPKGFPLQHFWFVADGEPVHGNERYYPVNHCGDFDRFTFFAQFLRQKGPKANLVACFRRGSPFGDINGFHAIIFSIECSYQHHRDRNIFWVVSVALVTDKTTQTLNVDECFRVSGIQLNREYFGKELNQ
jgi:hypothetical protein